MAVMLQTWPFKAPVAGFHRFTVAQYHTMIDIGLLTENDRVELLEGYLVEKMPHDPLHHGTLQKVTRRLQRVIPAGWEVRIQMAATLTRSEPEPDAAVVREDVGGYMTRHPCPADFGIVIEVSNTTLDSDRADKAPIYASDGLPVYWIVNVVDRQIEVHEQPSGAGDNSYRVYKSGDTVPLVLDGNTLGTIPATDLLPSP